MDISAWLNGTISVERWREILVIATAYGMAWLTCTLRLRAKRRDEDDASGWSDLTDADFRASPPVRAGQEIVCPRCSGTHTLIPARLPDGRPTDFVLGYRCGRHSYPGALAGKAAFGVRPKEEGGRGVTE